MISFTFKELSKQLGTLIEGSLSSDKKSLETLSYKNIVKSIVRGLLAAQLVPINLIQLANRHKLQPSILESSCAALLEAKLAEGELNGAVFTPRSFLDKRKDIIEKVFLKQGYIEFSWVTSHFRANKPENFLKKILGNDEDRYLYLGTCVFDASQLELLRSNLEENLESSGFCEIDDVLPSGLEPVDIEMIIKEKLNLKDVIINCEQNMFLSKKFMDKCVDQLSELLLSLVQQKIEGAETNDNSKTNKKKKKRARQRSFPFLGMS